MNQLDLFDPPHIALRKQSEYYRELAAPLVTKAKELEMQAVRCCPHEKLNVKTEYNDDDYGRTIWQHPKLVITCDFCEVSKNILAEHAYKIYGKDLEGIRSEFYQ